MTSTAQAPGAQTQSIPAESPQTDAPKTESAAAVAPATSPWVMAMTAAMAITAVVAIVLLVPTPALDVDWSLPGGVALAIAFYLADAYPLHIESRGETLSISVSEVPFIIGLLCCPPEVLITARCVGACWALVFKRRQRFGKLAFNAALQAFDTSVGVVVYRALPGTGDHHLLGAGTDAVLAVLASSIINTVAVIAVVWIQSGRLDRKAAVSYFSVTGLSLVPNFCAGLVLSVALWQSRAVVAPAVIVAVALAAAYRSYVEQRHRHDNLRMVYDFVRSVDTSATSESRIRHLLERTRAVLRSEHAEILLLTEDEPGQFTRRWVGADGWLQAETAASHPEDWPITMVATTGKPFLAARTPKDSSIDAFLTWRDWRDCLVVPLLGEGRTIGVLVVADRTSDVMTYTDEDARLLTTVAAQVSSVVENGQLVDRLTHDSSHDALTGLANRTTYQDRLHAVLDAENPPPVAVLIMDLDRFKEVNDTLGHHHGDLLIREVAGRLRGAAPSAATVARLGGDEFAVLLPETDLNGAQDAAKHLWDAVARPCSLDGVDLDVEASIGISVAPEHGTDASALLKRADMAMYAAKRARSHIEFYDADRDEYSPRRLALASQVRAAVDNGQLELHYQPQVDTRTGEVVAVEALSRWRHPEYGFVPPDEFIALAEQSGAIATLTHWALETAVRQLAQWRAAGHNLEISVNISMRNLTDTAMCEHVEGLVAQYGLAPGDLTLEVTESQVMSSPERTLPILNRLSALGARLSIDDFGTGYSSLGYLKQLPVTELKVDRAFVSGVATDHQDVAIVRAIVDLASSLGMRVVAEGVEDQPMLARVTSLGCDRIQGYLLSRPLPAGSLIAWLEGHREEAARNARLAASERHLSSLPALRSIGSDATDQTA